MKLLESNTKRYPVQTYQPSDIATGKTSQNETFTWKWTLPLVVLLMLAPKLVCAQSCRDSVFLKDGRVLKGIIVGERTNDYIKFKLDNGFVTKIPFNEIVDVKRNETKVYEVFDENRNLISDSYYELAVVAGAPALINFSFSYWYGLVGLRASGGYLGHHPHGIQGTLGVKLTDNPHLRHSLALLIGYFKMNSGGGGGGIGLGGYWWVELSGYFAGAVYELYSGGFFLQAGMMTRIDPTSHPTHPTPTFQVGYMYRFLSE